MRDLNNSGIPNHFVVESYDLSAPYDGLEVVRVDQIHNQVLLDQYNLKKKQMRSSMGPLQKEDVIQFKTSQDGLNYEFERCSRYGIVVFDGY